MGIGRRRPSALQLTFKEGMSHYFDHASQELNSKIAQARCTSPSTTRPLAHWPKRCFASSSKPPAGGGQRGAGLHHRQCGRFIKAVRHSDLRLAPVCPVLSSEGVVVVPAEAVIAIIEVKTSINRAGFHEVIRYFQSFQNLRLAARTYLFMFNAPTLGTVSSTFIHFDTQAAIRSSIMILSSSSRTKSPA
jgi:hypothetical protein